MVPLLWVLPLTIYHPLNVFRRDSFDVLRTLREESGLTASVVVFVGNERLVLDVSGIVGSLTPFYGTRLENPIHVSAAGKLLLLSKSAADRKAILTGRTLRRWARPFPPAPERA